MILLLPDAALSLSEEQRRKIACALVMVAAADGALVAKILRMLVPSYRIQEKSGFHPHTLLSLPPSRKPAHFTNDGV